MDDTYRNQLREMNELNWERFRSELRAVEAAVRSDLAKQLAEMDKRLDVRFGAIETRLTAMNAGLATVNDRFPAFEERLDAKFDAKFAEVERRMFKAMFWFWTATTIPLATLILALDGAFQR